MSSHADPHAGESMVGPHDSTDDHGGEALGPVDVRLWAAATGGVVLGLLVVLAFTKAVS